MRGYKCHICGGICDPGELENGVCFDCRKEDIERKEKHNLEIMKDINRKMKVRYKEQIDGQLTIGLM